mmetsp:Transcript_18762/g.40353  ORF Transcript_18762/g.40353 Transcript_18762/m.40353 type:complete len:161 (+) Transcript_18762:164-646(+)|eukprot:CAMPEP_0202894636 /NCGR_PEP_ID=MMETSP1392-20130828/3991_1 /ASSEMBLY_ACC=CAM_ASM_000868 /TAXON_ID=225041 /ORGANISM="Chlamydomonas chlamydogama, Strain SAG 11-48b" /LENGTH=160 /DNA_ID=CAMNT_0049579385 /DNA_START=164 /DNA_END=646 /DNA_ORIENTATION=-
MENLPLRNLLISVDESEGSIKAFNWALDNLYKEGDTVYVFHVIPPGQYMVLSTDLGIDEVIEDDPATQKKQEDHARQFLTSKFSPVMDAKKIPYRIEITKFATDNDSIGSIICKRAEQLNAAAVVMAKHSKGKLQEFFVGSVTSYCTHHCKSPVLVMHAD